MKLILLMSLAVSQMSVAATVCSSDTVKLKVNGRPNGQAEAEIQLPALSGPSKQFKGKWRVIPEEGGGLTSKAAYTLHDENGETADLLLITSYSFGHCGRGSCDFKKITAQLNYKSQQFVVSCYDDAQN